MFYSFIQTLVCVLLINGGLHALHLKGNGETTAKSAVSVNKAMSDPVVVLPGNKYQGFSNPNHEHIQHASSSLKQYETAGRLSDALADLAQLDREHLMSSIDKQPENIASEHHHGRPIITGRIHMSPKNDLVGESDYSSLLLPSLPRGFMFGHVVKHPPADSNDNSAGLTEEYTGNPRHGKYEYGRVVEPAHDTDYDTQHMPLDVDSFMELDQEPDVDDEFDLDSYQYLDELLAEDQQREWQELTANHRTSNPYQRVEDVPSDTPLDLMNLFHKSQGNPLELQQEASSGQRKFQTRSGFNPSNMRYQQKWHNKRARQLPLKRNIFAGQQSKQKQQIFDDQPQPQPRYFNQRHNSMLSTIGSEATAYSKNNNNNNHNNNQNNKNENENTKSAKELNDNLNSVVKTMRNNNNHDASMQRQQSVTTHNLQEHQQQQQPQPQQQQQTKTSEVRLKEETLVQSNQKRSSGGLIPPGMSAAGSHSIASQLMLRTARGQRQYDVPQIECPTAMDGMERFACPTPDLQGRYRCIDDHVLCDGFIDCPEGEDEDRRSCMFYKTTKAHLDVLADALLRWARGR